MQGDRCQPQQHNNQDQKVVNQEQHHEPQKCPRCESLNTKFCYYNNYSLSQPRYFCKSCRRYWTQGGTLRNVPIGGGCRKGKRAKNMSSSSSSSLSMLIQQHQQPHDHHQRSLMMSSGPPTTLNPLNSSQDYLGNAKYLTSMPFTQNLSHLGGSSQLGSGGASNLGMLYGFNDISSYGQCQRQNQIFKSNIGPPPHYQSDDYRTILLQPTRSSGAMTDWPESFIDKSHTSPAATSARQTALWSVSVGTNTSTTSGLAPSLNIVQRPNDLAGSFSFSPQ